jgi:hypothetical protein
VLAFLYLALAAVAGLIAVQRLFPNFPPFVRLAGGFLLGLLATAWMTFLVAYALAPFTAESVLVGAVAAAAANMAVLAWGWRSLDYRAFRVSPFEAAFAGVSLLFSFWLMWERLSGDPLTVAGETWGDTALHVALARSFSWGHNFPPEYPFAGGEPIRYHFGFDFFAGALNAQGMPIDWAFNIPGALGFACIMLLVFELARWLFRSRWVGVVAVVLLVTNGSLAFMEYMEKHNLDVGEAVSSLWDHRGYLAVGPYLVDGEIDRVSIFWTLNVFLTQTHLIVGMGLVLFVAYALVRLAVAGAPAGSPGPGAMQARDATADGVEARPARTLEEVVRGLLTWEGTLAERQALALGVVFGLSFWLNGVLFFAASAFFTALLLIFARWKEALLFLGTAAVLAAPQAVWLNGGSLQSEGNIRWHVGYLVDGFRFDDPGSWWDFASYWWLNLGLALPLFILGALWGSARDRKLMLAVMAIFVFGNFVQLSRDLGGHNHKIFNLWEILMNVFAAYAFVRLADPPVKSKALYWAGMVTLGMAAFLGIAAYLGNPDGGLYLIFVAIALAGLAVAAGSTYIETPGLAWPAQARLILAPLALTTVLFFLTLSGIIDFMTIKNDARYEVFGTKTPVINWIDANTEGDALFLTAYGELYTAPTLAGRRIFLGYEPWVGSAGYDVAARMQVVQSIYAAPDKAAACRLLTAEGIDYVYVGPSERSGQRFAINESLFAQQFQAAGTIDSPEGRVVIYDARASCSSGAGATG